jgi:tape measure domain-containing protein
MRPRGPTPGNVPGLPTPGRIDQTTSALGRLGGMLRTLVAGIGIVSIARISDEWAGIEGRVGLVTEGVQEQQKALQGLYDLSQRSRQSYGATATLFQAVARNGKELGLALDDQLQLTETIGRAMTIGGGSAASQQAALIQLSQALGTGTLRGEELNSIMEQSPRLAQAIAQAFGVPVGMLKKLGEQGKLASKTLAVGLLKQSETLREEFERMPLTFSGAWVILSNAMGRQIDKLNRNTGAAKIFYRVTSAVVDNLETIIKYIAWIGGAAVLTKFAMAARTMAAAGGLLSTILARFGGARAFGVMLGTFARMLAVVTAIYYVFDDIQGWFNGADSLIGRVLGPTSDWKWLIDGVKAGLTEIKNLFGGSAETLTQWVSKWGLIAVIIGGIVAAIGLIPALVVASTVALAAMFNWLRNNWNAIPEWVRKVIMVTTGLATGPFGAIASALAMGQQRTGPAAPGTAAGPAPFIGPGGAAFGVTPNMIPNRGGAGGTTVVTNAPQVTVNATTPQPAAVAAAAAQGTKRGMSASSMVPQVEASR